MAFGYEVGTLTINRDVYCINEADSIYSDLKIALLLTE
jgi:hypothetical protein